MNSRRRPHFCGFLKHLCRRLRIHHYGFATTLGLLLVALNVPVGWGSALVCVFLAAHWDKPFFYQIAALCYACSWLMLGAGVALAGHGTVKAVRAQIPRAWHAYRRLREIRAAKR